MASTLVAMASNLRAATVANPLRRLCKQKTDDDKVGIMPVLEDERNGLSRKNTANGNGPAFIIHFIKTTKTRESF